MNFISRQPTRSLALAMLVLIPVCVTGCQLVPLFPAHPESSGDYDIDSGHSAVIFQITHFGVANFYGRFNKVAGKVTLDLDNPQRNSLIVKVPASSLDTNSKDRDGHITSDEFLNVARYPEMSFKSTAFQRVGPSSFRVTGDLTLAGQTRPLTVDLEQIGYGEDLWGGWRTGFHTTFDVSRSEFGVTAMPNALGDIVSVQVTLEARRIPPAAEAKQ
ncbi:MAG: YceI family protein [Planctomycetota bacterium]